MVFLKFRWQLMHYNVNNSRWFSLQFCGPGWLSRYSDSLWSERSGDRIPVGVRFSAPVQTGPGVHPASYTMGTGSFLGVKWPGRGIDHPLPSSAEFKERVELYIYSPLAFLAWSRVNFYITVLLGYLVSMMMVPCIWAKTCCSKSIQRCKRVSCDWRLLSLCKHNIILAAGCTTYYLFTPVWCTYM